MADETGKELAVAGGAAGEDKPLQRAQWSRQTCSGSRPQPRGGLSCSVVDDRVYVYGGATASQELVNKLSILDTDKYIWTEAATKGTMPPGRSGHSAIVHGKRIIIFGGMSPVAQEFYNDAWALDTESMEWTMLETKGVSAIPRNSHSATVVGDTMVVIGGGNLEGLMVKVQTLNLTTLEWSTVTADHSAIAPREMHTAAFTGAGDLVVMGGRCESGPAADSVILSSQDFTFQRSVIMPDWARRAASTSCCLSASGWIVSFGGTDLMSPPAFNDTTLFNADSDRWWALDPPCKDFPDRFAHAMGLLSCGRLIVVGGVNFTQGELDDVVTIETSTIEFPQ